MPKRESCGSILLAPRPPSRSPPTYDPHSTRCQPVPNFPRLRALALFGRRPPQRVDSLLMPASENLHKETHALQQLALHWELSGTANVTNPLCCPLSRRQAKSEGDCLLKRHHPAVANSFAICAKPGWSACRKRSIIALFSGLASCSARTNIPVYPSSRASYNHCNIPAVFCQAILF
jgi:hypothetical protein